MREKQKMADGNTKQSTILSDVLKAKIISELLDRDGDGNILRNTFQNRRFGGMQDQPEEYEKLPTGTIGDFLFGAKKGFTDKNPDTFFTLKRTQKLKPKKTTDDSGKSESLLSPTPPSTGPTPSGSLIRTEDNSAQKGMLVQLKAIRKFAESIEKFLKNKDKKLIGMNKPLMLKGPTPLVPIAGQSNLPVPSLNTYSPGLLAGMAKNALMPVEDSESSSLPTIDPFINIQRRQPMKTVGSGSTRPAALPAPATIVSDGAPEKKQTKLQKLKSFLGKTGGKLKSLVGLGAAATVAGTALATTGATTEIADSTQITSKEPAEKPAEKVAAITAKEPVVETQTKKPSLGKRALGFIGKAGGKALGGLGAGLAAYEAYSTISGITEQQQEKLKEIDAALQSGEINKKDADEMKKQVISESKSGKGEVIGGVAGTVLGGVLGSVAGPVGTVLGSVAGSYVGSAAGKYGTKLYDTLFSSEESSNIKALTQKKSATGLASSQQEPPKNISATAPIARAKVIEKLSRDNATLMESSKNVQTIQPVVTNTNVQTNTQSFVPIKAEPRTDSSFTKYMNRIATFG